MATRAKVKAAPKAAAVKAADPYADGRKAAADGVNIARCPYKGAERALWIEGHTDAANEAAPERRRRRR